LTRTGRALPTRTSIDQLPGDADAIASLTNLTFEDVVNSEIPADLLYANRFSLVRKARIAGEDKEPSDARKRGDDLLDHAVDEVVLCGIAT
jgi:hypothetical protein